MKRACAAIFLSGLAGFASAEPVRPTVVSLDYCADQFVLALADRAQILAVSKDAERKFSHLRDKAAGIPKVRAAAEDVVALGPDLVVRSWGGDARALSLYERFGIRTVQLGYADDIDGAKAVTRDVAAEIGQAARAEVLLASLPAARPPRGLSALYVTPGGVSAGKGTMIEAIMQHAGLANANTGAGWTALPLERLVQAPPPLMLTAFFGFDDDATDRWSVSRHPVMQRLMRNARVIAMDESRVSCPAWLVADEAEAIARSLEASP
ncbi:MAG: ABC transporter substrate-binding protein [Hyphomonas sp.]|uniref:ABC transporter substrate-binding protein n=1 Tax=Hyphomonas sp. TaxID=87 RepID=UPI0017B67DD1|nr:ABC transporter substrate-binding protein [Hyphomonas sp.]MBU3920451.1 ABC transporter substrate-binding protein [Alphaproteobacteria bacterium]MBA3069970.1 ABC transporter substrate-binding protein [Hyphomonas sp.]MBU4060454.1 ABC transporter substrate-binding protein [Alphaproteobacteria bacterium]MBU4163122.1 ABC transporter substrate-binding protein [Alphaproteobacteria bacterium]MBU4569639.1 ABC transporter substrate-binding protein [Alphaproteobacteria bacterium]